MPVSPSKISPVAWWPASRKTTRTTRKVTPQNRDHWWRWRWWLSRCDVDSEAFFCNTPSKRRSKRRRDTGRLFCAFIRWRHSVLHECDSYDSNLKPNPRKDTLIWRPFLPCLKLKMNLPWNCPLKPPNSGFKPSFQTITWNHHFKITLLKAAPILETMRLAREALVLIHNPVLKG